ncbi:MAG: hypothetical protein M3499_06515 [Actinomycetota bacterium]|nr:hypothetical protein [Actinomycetota bacterium]
MMAAARRSRLRLPRDVKELVGLERGERALAWAFDASGRWYVGSDRALHLPSEEGHRRVPWEQVERADWQRDKGRLSIVEVADWSEPERRTVVGVDEAGELLELLRERVTKSVVVSVYAPVRGRLGLSVVGRRSPAGAGPITWSTVLAAGLAPDEPDVREVAGLALRKAEAEVAGLV